MRNHLWSSFQHEPYYIPCSSLTKDYIDRGWCCIRCQLCSSQALLPSLGSQHGVTAQVHITSLQLGTPSPLPLTTALCLLLRRATTASNTDTVGKPEVAEVYDTLPGNETRSTCWEHTGQCDGIYVCISSLPSISYLVGITGKDPTDEVCKSPWDGCWLVTEGSFCQQLQSLCFHTVRFNVKKVKLVHKLSRNRQQSQIKFTIQGSPPHWWLCQPSQARCEGWTGHANLLVLRASAMGFTGCRCRRFVLLFPYRNTRMHESIKAILLSETFLAQHFSFLTRCSGTKTPHWHLPPVIN